MITNCDCLKEYYRHCSVFLDFCGNTVTHSMLYGLITLLMIALLRSAVNLTVDETMIHT
jgi:hypothetical protein